ncbi:hypothetical protein [Asticcacaulis solisilvae]|uniref:hypothetical protein n=1 Tax=Asticcacaulis solisilvae TaxID=1217274 RepID=UPI003FD74B49
MSPSILKPALAATALLAAAVPVAALANGTCAPARTVHKVKAVHRVAVRPVRTVRTRTVVRYVAPPVRTVVVYRTHPRPIYRPVTYVRAAPVVYTRYGHDYVRHDYYGYRHHWRHYDWHDDGPY